MLKKFKFFSLLFASALPVLLLVSTFSIPKDAGASVVQFVQQLCENPTARTVSWPTNGSCSSGLQSIKPTELPSTFRSICLVFEVGTQSDQIYEGVTISGQSGCSDFSNDSTNFNKVKSITRAQISGNDPSVTTTPPIITPPATSTTTKPSTTTPGVSPKTITKTPSTSSNTPTSKVNDAGGCPDGFTSKGPLCIPNNPFGSGDGIAGKGSLGELASTIISILLGLAGIVAVIMIIIGGYQVMTARGNENQATDGRKTLTNALIGLAIIVVSYAVVQALTNYLISPK